MAPIQTPQEITEQIIEEFTDEDCKSIYGGWVEISEEEWGTRYLTSAGGGDDAMRIEHDEINNKWRYNYFIRNEIEELNHAYIIADSYGTEHFTELEPPEEFYNNDDYIVINMLE